MQLIKGWAATAKRHLAPQSGEARVALGSAGALLAIGFLLNNPEALGCITTIFELVAIGRVAVAVSYLCTAQGGWGIAHRRADAIGVLALFGAAYAIFQLLV